MATDTADRDGWAGWPYAAEPFSGTAWLCLLLLALPALLPPEQGLQLGAHQGKIQPRLPGMLLGDGHDVTIIWQKSLMQAIELPQQALEPITCHGIADLA